MSLIIKGMKMPKDGFVEILIRDDGTVQQTGQSYRIEGTDYYAPYIGETPVMYEAVTILPHGRLIDADAIFKDICDDINAMTAVGIAVDGQWLWDKLNDALENTPTIIPASEES